MSERSNKHTRKILSEPLSPVFFTAYTTLISVTQGVSLGAGFYILSEVTNKDWVYIFKAFMTFITVCLVWHRFITFTQYLIWRLGVLDTLIPMSIAVSELFIILSIPKTTSDFFWVFAVLPLLGALSYGHAWYHFASPEAKAYVRDFFEKQGYHFADDFLWEMNRFAWRAIIVMLSLVAYCVLVSIFIDKVPLSAEMKTYLSTGIFALWLIFLFRFDLPRNLNQSQRQSLRVIEW